MTVLLAVTAGVLCAAGTYLVLGRQLSRIVIGIGLVGHGVNVLVILSGGDGGAPAFVGGDPGTFADPLPQALVLTAIVITFGVIAFLLSLAFRSWRVTADDEVEDDVEDRRIAREATHLGDDGVDP
ncbi:MAG TPA: NADH-quinone oxidoreductase subunit K [Acidimicrobiales bacterium]|nr:NADH-quinone oxidoreductase subunit K [Acidimicrobiales bacterium]